MNQEDTERLQELEESFENGDLNKEDDEEEWEELQSLRADRRRVKGRSKTLSAWKKAKKVWRTLDSEDDTIDGYLYSLTGFDNDSDAVEVDHPGDLGVLRIDDVQGLFWFAKPED